MRTKLLPPWRSGRPRIASRCRKFCLALLITAACWPLLAAAADQPPATPATPTSPPPLATMTPDTLRPLLNQVASHPATTAERKALLIRLQSLAENQSESARREAAAVRAGMLLQMLRHQAGEALFLATSKSLLASDRPLDWPAVRQAFVAANPELGNFFSQWLDRQEIPQLTIKGVTMEEQEGKVRLSFTLVQEQAQPATLVVPIRVTSPAEKITQQITASAAETPVSFTLTELPTELLLDPEYHLLRTLVADEYPPVWARYRNSVKPLAVVPDNVAASPFAPLVERLRSLGCETIPAATVKDTDLAGRNVLFLGLDTPIVRSLFARPPHPAGGFTLEVRANPLGPEEVAVLISAASATETTLALPRLFDGLDLATFAHLAGGTIRQQRTADADMGIGWWLDQPPTGVALANQLGFAAIMERLRQTRVVFIGETHDKFEDHQLQLRVIRAMHRQTPKVAIGMEMFPRPTQKALDAYVAGTIDEREFLKQSRYFTNWGFDFRFYRDILAFARANHLPVVALNLDKGIPNKIFRAGGLAALTPEETATLPPERDLGLPGYRERVADAFAMHEGHAPQKGLNNFLQAQALWDETMAVSAADFLATHPDYRLAMVVGQGHALKDTAIPPRLARRLPVSEAVLLPAREEEIKPSEADYLITVTPAPLPPLPTLGVKLTEKEKGVRIDEVLPEGVAGKAGLETGDDLLAVDGQPIATIDELKIALLYRKKGETMQVRVLRHHTLLPDEVMTIAVPL